MFLFGEHELIWERPRRGAEGGPRTAGEDRDTLVNDGPVSTGLGPTCFLFWSHGVVVCL